MRRLGPLVCLALLAGACTATPITLPVNQDGAWSTGPDMGVAQDGAAMDVAPPGGDMTLLPDLGETGDAANAKDGAAMDAVADGVCLECPLVDGMPDQGAGDAEAGTAEVGPAADATNDLLGGDLGTGD